MRVLLVRFREVASKYPVARGMASYALIWPVASCIQQKVTGKEHLDAAQAFRFSVYGGLFVAPTLYYWLKFAARIWPRSNLKSAVTKALVEQVTYGPTAMCCFFFGINLLEFKPVSECINEVKDKFWPTYKIGVCVWPFLQTINFLLVPEAYRVVYVSICSLMWTSFLAYMKSLEARRNSNKKLLVSEVNEKAPEIQPEIKKQIIRNNSQWNSAYH